MSAPFNPEYSSLPAENLHIAIAGQLDESARHAMAYFETSVLEPLWFGNSFRLKSIQRMLEGTRLTVNIALAYLEGIPVIFDNSDTRTTEIGIVEACGEFSMEKGGWEMAVNTPRLATAPGMPRLATVFGPGELAESYQRALTQSHAFLRPKRSRTGELAYDGSLPLNVWPQSMFGGVIRKLF